MSSAAVRTAIETELAIWCAANTIELVDTVNKADRPTTEKWAAVEFAKLGNEAIDFTGTRFIEDGTADITINVAAGGGDDEAATLADSLAAHFAAVGPLGSGVEVLSVEPPEDFGASGVPDGRFFGLSVTLNYQKYPT